MAVPVFVSKVVIENSIDVEAASPKSLTVGLRRGLVKMSTTRTAKVPAGEVGRETYPSGSTGRAILERNLDIHNTEDGGSVETHAHIILVALFWQ